ncbi:MAG: hypothetical protein GY749_20770 [Desulfobacteraceae bacterium]|nr:hypothetical protein [Desulfobacteraceae bacterium]
MQFTVRISDDYGEKLALIAKNIGLKKSEIVRLALKQFTDEILGESQEMPYEKVSHLLGIAESGINDLGQRHKNDLQNRFT